jgi:bifunctional non-homologous end joining protein LigD
MTRKKTPKISSSEAVDEQLARYRAMRDFSLTAEPSGNAQKQSGDLPFVIQKHAATRLHYDFRLGWHGVLKSWAVAKGPSYYPGDKRLAVQVEDHPMEYGGFEGTIPKGQYGGGTVMVWDQGTWEPQGDAEDGFKTGRLKFVLHGQKLKGKWTLVRMGGRAAKEAKPNWLLIKEHDEYERSAEEEPIAESEPDSVVTGRDIEAIGAQEDHVWQSKESKKRNLSRLAQRRLQFNKEKAEKQVTAPDRSSALNGIPEEKMPAFIPPHLATQVSGPPDGDDWLHELKLDGYRIQIHILEEKAGERRVTLYTRGGLDWTHRMPDLATKAAQLPVKSALIDGEVVVLDSSGKTSFADLQAAFQEEKHAHLIYFAFDLLHLDGHTLRRLALDKRKAILEGLLGELGNDSDLRYSQHIRGRGEETFRNACKLGAEGIVSKLADSKYTSGRSKTWLKAKCVHQQEFVIGGFTPPTKGGPGVGSLLLGYYQDGKLMYAGRTGTGFTQTSQKTLRNRLDELQQAKASFAELTADAKKDAVWVSPELVAEVQFATWTGDHRVRQASFQGLREDKAAKEIRREEAVAMPKPSRDRKEKSQVAPAEKPTSKATGQVSDLRLTHPDKILDDESKLTKQQLAEYYFEVADHLLPYIAGRPLSIVRCPDGSGKPCFFQKHIGQGVPKGINSVTVPNKKGGGSEEYITVSTREGVLGFAQIGVLEIHPWGSQNDSLEKPDQIIFDLDPDAEIEWKTLVESANEVRDVLKELGLVSFVKSTGGKGLHVVAPVQPKHEWAEVKEFTRNVARVLEASRPERYLIKMTKSARKGRIFLDYLRNDRGSTAVAPYSPRARKGVRVAIPLRWEDLRKGNPTEFGVANFDAWKRRLKDDPWEDFQHTKQALTEKAIRAAAHLAEPTE